MPKVIPSAKSAKKIHPYSRRAEQVHKLQNHLQRIDKRKKERKGKVNQVSQKILWFKEHLDPDLAVYQKQDMIDLVEKYLGRFADELEQIDIMQNISAQRSQQHISRQNVIRFTMEKEQRDFENGEFEIPNLGIKENLEYLKNWDGSNRFLPNIKITKIRKE